MMNFTRSTLACLLILSASGTAVAGGYGHKNLAGTEWRPVKIGRTAVFNLKPYFRFNEDGKVIGHGGCNGFGGAYKLKGRKVRFTDLYSTLMACPGTVMENERGFLRALGKAKRMKRKGTKLVLYSKGGKKLAVFIERH